MFEVCIINGGYYEYHTEVVRIFHDEDMANDYAMRLMISGQNAFVRKEGDSDETA